MALATGRAAVLGNLPVGEAVDLAARLLRRRADFGPEPGRGGVWLDELSASLLARRFAPDHPRRAEPAVGRDAGR